MVADEVGFWVVLALCFSIFFELIYLAWKRHAMRKAIVHAVLTDDVDSAVGPTLSLLSCDSLRARLILSETRVLMVPELTSSLVALSPGMLAGSRKTNFELIDGDFTRLAAAVSV